MKPNLNRAWSILFARLVLGLIFFMAGVMKVFQLGPLEHARKIFSALLRYLPPDLVALGSRGYHSVHRTNRRRARSFRITHPRCAYRARHGPRHRHIRPSSAQRALRL